MKYTATRRRSGALIAGFKRNWPGEKCCEVCQWTPPFGLRELHEDASSMLHAHHVIPLSCDGDDDEWNLALLCPTHHAVAHKLGKVRRKRRNGPKLWDGPREKEQLLGEMRMLEADPGRFAIYIAGGRKWETVQNKLTQLPGKST